MEKEEFKNAGEPEVGQSADKLPDKKNKLVWSLLSVAIAALTIWAVMAQNKDFSLATMIAEIGEANPWWIGGAILSMFCYIGFEAMALLCILREFGYNMSLGKGFVYSSADIYFSAITPSATGGQPASAFFMHRDGIPTTLAAVVLLANLLMYSCSTVGIGLLSTAIAPLTITRFSTASQILVIVGFVIQVALLVLLFLVITKERIILTLGNGIISFLGRIKILRRPDEKKKKFAASMDEYKEHAAALKGKKRMMLKVFVFNLLQRIFQILVTVFTYVAMYDELAKTSALHPIRAFSLQAYVSIGAYCIPIPGSMGVTDALMIDGFSRIGEVPVETLTFELLSRTISFYSCILICGLAVLISYIAGKKRRAEI